MLDVTRLRVLVAVARHGSVTAAARALNYAQPSVSHHLARLEAETGARLTQRAGRGIRLTDAGPAARRAGGGDPGQAGRRRAGAGRTRRAAAGTHPAGGVRLRAGDDRSRRAVPAARPGTPGSTCCWPRPSRRRRCGCSGPGRWTSRWSPGTRRTGPRRPARRRGGRPDPADPRRAGSPGDQAAAPRHRRPAGAASRRPARRRLSREEASRRGGQPAAGEAGTPDLAAHAHSPWIAGCEHCRGHLIWLCQHAGFSPKIAFTTDDYVAAQALVAAGLGVTIMPGLAINAARHPGIHAQPAARRLAAGARGHLRPAARPARGGPPARHPHPRRRGHRHRFGLPVAGRRPGAGAGVA